ncbi:hypothetical protein [Streptomyces kanamyceticus]|uniref:hypothetical protein n=1 Tax=Streptomyces kanamyceticus TaxID=1967 RepID=UPI0037DC9493
MNDLTLELSREQTVLLTTMAHQYLLEGAWPVWQYVVSTLDGLDLDAEELIRSLPRVGSRGHIGPSYGLTSHIGHHLAEDDQPALTVAASLHVPELQPYVADPFLRVLQTLIQLQRSAPISTREVTRPQFGAADIEKETPGLPRGFLDRLPGVLAPEPATWGGSSGTAPDGVWWRELRREIRKYRDVKTIQEYVQATARFITAQVEEMLPASAPTVPAPAQVPGLGAYISQRLIADLEAKDTVFELDKLLALLRELNANHADQHSYACQMLLRAVLDHIPPAFGQTTFAGVVDNVSWGKTDKAYMKTLSAFRKPADDVLHRQLSTQPSHIEIHDLPPRSYVNALLQGVLAHLPAAPQPHGS